ncbi:MAG: hypothetical protein ACYTA5_25925, partial [Planctomycetota bacterium]
QNTATTIIEGPIIDVGDVPPKDEIWVDKDSVVNSRTGPKDPGYDAPPKDEIKVDKDLVVSSKTGPATSSYDAPPKDEIIVDKDSVVNTRTGPKSPGNEASPKEETRINPSTATTIIEGPIIDVGDVPPKDEIWVDKDSVVSSRTGPIDPIYTLPPMEVVKIDKDSVVNSRTGPKIPSYDAPPKEVIKVDKDSVVNSTTGPKSSSYDAPPKDEIKVDKDSVVNSRTGPKRPEYDAPPKDETIVNRDSVINLRWGPKIPGYLEAPVISSAVSSAFSSLKVTGPQTAKSGPYMSQMTGEDGITAASKGQYAGNFTSDYLSGTTKVVSAEYTGTGNYMSAAIYGKCHPGTNHGYGGVFDGGYVGVRAQAFGSGNPIQYGVYATVHGWSTVGDKIAVFGDAAAANNNYGAVGEAHGGGINFGVYGRAYNGTVNWAGYFLGNVRVTGTFTNPKSSYIIDHPTAPESKYLTHTSVSSPDMMNVYNGNVVTDYNGYATVQLPEYFSSLNRDFRYQLTVIGQFAQAIVSDKIAGNRFSIRTDEPNVEVSWQVTGIRNDAFARANSSEAVQNKPADDQGTYLHPEVFGLSPDRAPAHHRPATDNKAGLAGRDE